MTGTDDGIDVISIGSIIGGTMGTTREWDSAVTRLMCVVAERRVGVASGLGINVVFQIPGEVLKPDFEGVRTGYYSKKENLLMVQVALPEELPDDIEGYLRRELAVAVDEAEAWGRRRRVAADLNSLRDLVERL